MALGQPISKLVSVELLADRADVLTIVEVEVDFTEGPRRQGVESLVDPEWAVAHAHVPLSQAAAVPLPEYLLWTGQMAFANFIVTPVKAWVW
jgi:hypothetical protein